MKLILSILTLSFAILATTGDGPDESDEAFFENMKALCGESYPGFIPEGMPSRGFSGEMVAHFGPCDENQIRIPFHVGEDESRTWILTMEEEGLLFKHDHRYPDGTPEEMTNYGGWADNEGTELGQYFPADEHTISLRDNLRSHIWKFEISEDHSTLSYSLYLYEDLYFRADFNLNETL